MKELQPRFSAHWCEVTERLLTPIWVFDISERSMRWANTAALRLWNAESGEELLQRDWAGEMSAAVARRLDDYLERFRLGQTISEHWTFYPRGEPVNVLCHCSAIQLADGRLAMLVEGAKELPSVDAPSRRALEALRHTSLLVSVFDESGRVLTRNPAAASAHDPQAKLPAYFVEEGVWRFLDDRARRHGVASADALVRQLQGERWHNVELRRSRDPETGRGMQVLSEVDVTERKNSELNQATANRRLAVLIESLDHGVLVEDRDRRVVLANRRFCDLLGIEAPPEALTGADCREAAERAKDLFVDPEHFIQGIEERLRRGERAVDTALTMHSGRVLERSYSPVLLGERQEGHLWQYRDITAARHRETRLMTEAATDPLTGLGNRRFFAAHAARELGRLDSPEQSHTLLLLDIDRFKRINDSWGHAVGDRVLELLAGCIAGALRDRDLCARIGGEEFATLLPETPHTEGAAIAERLRHRIADWARKSPNLPTPVSVSIGVAPVLPGDDTIDAALSRADEALYAAKRNGRDRVASYADLQGS